MLWTRKLQLTWTRKSESDGPQIDSDGRHIDSDGRQIDSDGRQITRTGVAGIKADTEASRFPSPAGLDSVTPWLASALSVLAAEGKIERFGL